MSPDECLLSNNLLFTPFTPAPCADGTDPVACFVNPCDVNACPAYPDAECVADYCGGCNARFYDEDGTEVTEDCTG